jgi:hypothetical protein
MTKKTIKKWFIGAIVVFGLAAAAGVLISTLDRSPHRLVYSTYKDLVPLLLGIAAVWLGYCVQRRSAYQQQLRSMWSSLVEAVYCALQYCQIQNPTEEQHRAVLIKLSVAIDEVRGVFRNLPDPTTPRGFYPFEPIKDIYRLLTDLGSGQCPAGRDATTCYAQIFALWKDVRDEILKEFDREIPTFPHSHWADLAKARVYDAHGIRKQAT